MIKKECFTTEWIEQVASKLHYNDKNIIEKVIRALSLLEMLVKAGCPLVFKGGTALCISTRGKAGEGDFNLIQDGIIRVKSFMYKQRYLIDNAIIDAARTAYLATLIEKGITDAYSGLMSASYSGDTRPPLLYIAKISIFLSHGITFESEAYRFVNNSI